MAGVVGTTEASSTPRSVQAVDRTIAELESSVRRMARLRHGHVSSAVALSRTYRAERQIAVLRAQRSALLAGDVSRADELHRRFIALGLHDIGPHEDLRKSSLGPLGGAR